MTAKVDSLGDALPVYVGRAGGAVVALVEKSLHQLGTDCAHGALLRIGQHKVAVSLSQFPEKIIAR